MKMNKFLAAIAVATVVGSTPALAQSWDPDVGSGNIAPAPYGENLNGSNIYQHSRRGFGARAQAFHRHPARSHRSDVIRGK
jgi:hypothetical protein